MSASEPLGAKAQPLRTLSDRFHIVLRPPCLLFLLLSTKHATTSSSIPSGDNKKEKGANAREEKPIQQGDIS